jgi:hypothetical protein
LNQWWRQGGAVDGLCYLFSEAQMRRIEEINALLTSNTLIAHKKADI